jgi:hypothetical protein
MSVTSIPLSDSGVPFPRQTKAATPAREIRFLVIGYIIAFFLAMSSLGLCGPGCCFAFYSILAIASGLFLLRRAFYTRVFCLAILLFSIVGMWHEKVTRDSWAVRDLQQQIQDMQSAQSAKTP